MAREPSRRGNTAGARRLGRDPQFATQPERRKNAAVLNLEVSRCLAREDSRHWIERLSAADVLCAEVLDYAGFRAAPQTVHGRTFQEIDQYPYGPLPLPRVPGGSADWPLAPTPRVGEHTLEILAALGLPESERSALVATGVVRQAA